MPNYRRWTDPLLQEKYGNAADGSRQKLHTSLALLPVDSNQREYLYGRLLDADPHELPVIRDALFAHKQALLNKLWAALEQPAREQEHRRLRAACALATYDPDGLQWAKFGDRIANDLVSVPPVYLERWMDALRPVGAKLVVPLSGIFQDANRGPTERTLATNILADYAADQPGVLADLLMDADEKQFAILYPTITVHGESGLSCLLAELNKHPPPGAEEDSKEKLAMRQANAGVALLRMDRPEMVWPLLKHGPDPRARSYLIHRVSPFGVDPRVMVARLQEEKEVSIRRALLLALGEFSAQEFPPIERDALIPKLLDLYRHDPDPGIHGCAGWLVRHWGRQDNLKETDQLLATGKVEGERRWYVNKQMQTFVVVPRPDEFPMGSPPTEAGRYPDEILHHQRIGRTFAIATAHVTVEQFKRFNPQFGHSQMHRYPDPDCPLGGVIWYQAAAYCNWLSEQEGLPLDQWCYVPNRDGKFAEGMQLAPDYLRCTGYRLPTETEWEYACRAGAVTSRFYGQSDQLLEKYGSYIKNSGERTWPAGSLKPNDLGLFDMHGALFVWCQERYRAYGNGKVGSAIEDCEDILFVNDKESRVMRGGAFLTPSGGVRSARRGRDVPTLLDDDLGFRLARTFR